MANVEPPPIIARVVDVLDPGGNHFVVYVRMPQHLANKFPDRAWGTKITEIGLAHKDIVKFPDYVLVDIEPISDRRVGDSADLMWVFQRLGGPEWSTASKSRDNLTPAKYRGQTDVLKTEQEVVPETTPTTLTGDLVSSVVARLPNTGKAVLTEITETIAENAEPLRGKKVYVERVIADTEERLVNDGTAPETGLFVIDSQVSPLGNGKSVKDTVTYTPTGDPAAWPIHAGSTWSADLGAQIPQTEQYVAPPSGGDFDTPNTSYRIVNSDRSLKIVEVVPTDALNNYALAFPVRIDLDLPKVLKAASVVWSSKFSVGNQSTQAYDTHSGESGSVSLSIPDSANSSASISASLQLTFEDFASNNVFAENRVFFMQGPVTQATLLAKLTAIYTALNSGTATPVTMWPVFKPQSTTITVQSQSVGVRANVQVSLNNSWGPDRSSSGWTKSVSDDLAVDTSTDTVQLSPCIHPAIAITDATPRSQMVSATAVMGLASSHGAYVSANITKSGTASASVTPTTIPTTSEPTAVPITGLYLFDMQVAPADYSGWFKVRAVVFDASNLGPS